MKPLVAIVTIFLFIQHASAQSPDYIAVRKKNGRTIKNFFAGSDILLQTIDGSYLQGPIQTVRNDSVFILLYDIRYFPTTLGTMVRDTISVQTIPLHYKDIKRIQLLKRQNFLERTVSPLLIFGGAGYLVLNALNGTFFSSSVTGSEKLRTAGTGAGLFGIGYFIKKVFGTEGFSKQKHRIVYVDL